MSKKQPDQPYAATAIVGRVYREHIKSYIPKMILAAILSALFAGATSGQAYIIKEVVDEVIINHDRDVMILIAMAVGGLLIAAGILDMAQGVLMEGVANNIVADVQKRLFGSMLRQDLAQSRTSHNAEKVSALIYDSALLHGGVSKAFTGIAKDSLTAIGLIGVMVYQDWKLALGSLIILPLAAWPIQRLSKRTRKVTKRMQTETGRFSTVIDEMTNGLRHVKAFDAEEREIAHAGDVIADRVKAIMKGVYIGAMTSPLTSTLGGISAIIILIYGGERVGAGEITSGELVSFFAAMMLAYRPLKSLAKFNNTVQQGISAAARIFDQIDIEPKIIDLPEAQDLELDGVNSISFDRVRFAYHPSETVLNDIDLEFAKGKKTALVGPSGSGKSTIINLVARFYDTDQGQIRFGDQEIRQVRLASLRDNVALVSQDAFLFDTTIRKNIAYGNPDATEDEIIQAAKDAAAHDFIMALPDGYDTDVGQDGGNLSGGQRQRINIARAMLRNAPILLLDEATSALDAESEKLVQQALDRLMQGRTSIVVAHRLSTIRNSDRIYVMEQGRVTESGNHDELVALNGIYASMHKLQQHGIDVG